MKPGAQHPVFPVRAEYARPETAESKGRPINKARILSELRRAKAAHIKWRSYAYAMVAGLEIEPDFAPLEHTECAFGQWYHGSGRKAFGHLDSYAGIDVPHHILHKLYQRIYDLAMQGQRAEAEREVARLTELSRQVLEALALVEQELAEMA